MPSSDTETMQSSVYQSDIKAEVSESLLILENKNIL